MNHMELNKFLDSDADGLYYVGHASIIVRLSKKNILFDYVAINEPYGDSWKFFPELQDGIDMNKIDYVFVSHIHQDHYDVKLLKNVMNKSDIYIIGGRPPFEESLKKEGIKFNVIDPNQVFKLDDNISVLGILHDNNGIDASCYIGNNNFSVYHGNDNYTSNQTLKTISDEFGGVDVACIPYAYINWYPQLLENMSEKDRKLESERLVTHYYDYAIEQAKILNAKQVIPFGANLVYFDNARSPLNMECKSPLDFEMYVRSKFGNKEGDRFKALFTGDSIEINNGELNICIRNSYDQESYRDEMQKYLNSFPAKQKINRNLETHSIRGDYQLREFTNHDHFLYVRQIGNKNGVSINLRNGKLKCVEINTPESLEEPYYLVTVNDDQLYEDWLVGEVSMEEVIGARKFSLYRSPNTYDSQILRIMTTQI